MSCTLTSRERTPVSCSVSPRLTSTLSFSLPLVEQKIDNDLTDFSIIKSIRQNVCECSSVMSSGQSSLQNPGIKLRHFRIQTRRLQRRHQNLTRLHRINNRIDPKPRRAIPRISLGVIRRLDLVIDSLP